MSKEPRPERLTIEDLDTATGGGLLEPVIARRETFGDKSSVLIQTETIPNAKTFLKSKPIGESLGTTLIQTETIPSPKG